MSHLSSTSDTSAGGAATATAAVTNKNKIKYEQLQQFKKDVVIKKLLKTIDVMNREMSEFSLFQ